MAGAPAGVMPLAPGRRYTRCDPAQFEFVTTDDIESLDTMLGINPRI